MKYNVGIHFVSSSAAKQKAIPIFCLLRSGHRGASALPTTELVANTKLAVVMIQTGDNPYQPTWLGTGFFITPHWIATNSHVLRGSPKEEFQTNCHVLLSQGWILEQD